MESGPGNITLIAIRNGLKKPLNLCFRSADSALPEFEDTPTLLQQFVPVSYISLHVLLELCAPEIFARLGIGRVPASGVPVPEATMNE